MGCAILSIGRYSGLEFHGFLCHCHNFVRYEVHGLTLATRCLLCKFKLRAITICSLQTSAFLVLRRLL